MSAPAFPPFIDPGVLDQMHYTLSRVHAERRTRYLFWWVWSIRVFVVGGICLGLYFWKRYIDSHQGDTSGLHVDDPSVVPMVRMFDASPDAPLWKKKRDWTPLHAVS